MSATIDSVARCRHGHELTASNLLLDGACRTCKIERNRRWEQQRDQAADRKRPLPGAAGLSEDQAFSRDAARRLAECQELLHRLGPPEPDDPEAMWSERIYFGTLRDAALAEIRNYEQEEAAA